MITHGNIVATCAGVMTVIPSLGAQDVYLAYLPLAHVFELAAEVPLDSHLLDILVFMLFLMLFGFPVCHVGCWL